MSVGIATTAYMAPADAIVGWINRDGSLTLLDTWSASYNMVRVKLWRGRGRGGGGG